jgi:hypothetical protein
MESESLTWRHFDQEVPPRNILKMQDVRNSAEEFWIAREWLVEARVMEVPCSGDW